MELSTCFVNKKKCFTPFCSVLLFLILSVVNYGIMAQNQGFEKNIYYTNYTSDTALVNDTTVYLPVLEVTNKALADSIKSTISQLEKNNNYDEMPTGYYITTIIATYDIDSCLNVYFQVFENNLAYIYLTDKHRDLGFEYLGCIRYDNYIFVVGTYCHVSRKEIYSNIRKTNEVVILRAFDTYNHNDLFVPRPFIRMIFDLPLKDKNNFVPPERAKEYLMNFKE